MQLMQHARRAVEASQSWCASPVLIAGLAFCCKARAGQKQARRAVVRGPHGAS